MVAFYYLLIHADGGVKEKEVKAIYSECINALKNCTYNEQVRIIAWMSRIASSDGFMDPREWKLIYQVYFRELGMDLQDILNEQRNLPYLCIDKL